MDIQKVLEASTLLGEYSSFAMWLEPWLLF